MDYEVRFCFYGKNEQGGVFMESLRDPLFLRTDFLNIYEKDKKSPSISVRVNLQRDDLIFVQSVKSRMEVYGYVNPDTGLFVTETEDMEPGSIYHRFRLEAVKFARQALMRFLDSLEKLDEETYKQKGYKPYPILANALKQCLTDRQELYADLQKQVNLITSRKFPKINEYLVFEDEEEIKYPVTAKVPYPNPSHITLTDSEKKQIDTFLNVFFDPYNKFTFSWYIGAALSNVPIYDDRVSKLAILSSSLGGSGKSTLVTAMVNALFTQHYRDIKDDFDSLFASNNRFGTSTLSTKRICIYSEASFHSDPLSDEHNFTGMNVSAIKSMITEGYIASEEKFGDRNMERLSGFHLVLTNHPPLITQENQAMNRRILPIMLKPTSMSEKARELNLWGRQKLDAFIVEHAKEFAAYFTAVFHSDEYAFLEHDYDYRDYVQDIKDSQSDLNEQQKKGRALLDALKADSLIKLIEGLEKQHHLNLKILKDDVTEIMGGGTNSELGEHIKLSDKCLYINASKSFLLRYGVAGTKIRECLKEFYGEPVKKFHKRMFEIPIKK